MLSSLWDFDNFNATILEILIHVSGRKIIEKCENELKVHWNVSVIDTSKPKKTYNESMASTLLAPRLVADSLSLRNHTDRLCVNKNFYHTFLKEIKPYLSKLTFLYTVELKRRLKFWSWVGANILKTSEFTDFSWIYITL